jgi:hypothetical protein
VRVTRRCTAQTPIASLSTPTVVSGGCTRVIRAKERREFSAPRQESLTGAVAAAGAQVAAFVQAVVRLGAGFPQRGPVPQRTLLDTPDRVGAMQRWRRRKADWTADESNVLMSEVQKVRHGRAATAEVVAEDRIHRLAGDTIVHQHQHQRPAGCQQYRDRGFGCGSNTGRRPLSALDNVIKEWQRRGGDQMRQEYEQSMKA